MAPPGAFAITDTKDPLQLRTSAMDGSATGILEQLRDEHSRLREMITEKLPRDMEKRQKRLKVLRTPFCPGNRMDLF